MDSVNRKEATMKRTALITVLAAAALAVSAGGTFLANAGTALAPEPAMLTADLVGSNGSTAAALGVDTNVRTDVVKWPKSYTYGPWLAAGTPCSNIDLSANQVTSSVIQATGNYRKCYMA